MCLNFGHLFVALSLKVYYGYGVYDVDVFKICFSVLDNKDF